MGEILARYDALLPKVADTKKACDSLWKSYQYTDELTPHMEWLTEKKVLATRDINSNSAGETEELIEKQEKVIDQLDKKRKVTLLSVKYHIASILISNTSFFLEFSNIHSMI